MPDEARDGRNVALKWQLEVKSHLLACLIVQNNHPTINSGMPNNFHASEREDIGNYSPPKPIKNFTQDLEEVYCHIHSSTLSLFFLYPTHLLIP